MDASIVIITSLAAVIVFLFVGFYFRLGKNANERKDQETQDKRRLYEISILKAIQDRIGYSLDSEKVVDTITNSLKNVFDYSAASSLIMKEDKILFKSYLEEPVSTNFVEQVKKSMLASLAALSDKPLPEKIEESKLGSPPDESSSKILASFFHIPLVVGGQAVGLINVSSTKPGLYKDDDMTILYQITNQASTALSKLKEVLNTEEGKLLAMIASLSDGIFMVDAQNALTLINDTAKKMLKLTAPRLTIFDVISPLSKNGDFGSHIQRALRENKVVHIPDISLNERILQIIITPVTSSANSRLQSTNYQVIGAAITLRDVTIEKQMARLKEDFTSAIVHELRSPLTAIKSGSALFLEEKDKLDPDQQKHMLTIINKQSERMLMDINSLLDAAKLESGHFTVMKIPGNIEEILQEAAEFFGPRAHEKGISLELSATPGLPEIPFDPNRITQVVNNLISNSMKFTPSGGKIILKSDSFLDETTHTQYIKVSIADTGMGIPKEKQSGLFSKFAQVQNIGYIHGSEGTGLGLYITKGIVEAHGGTINLDSVPQHGTTVSFTLPIPVIKAAETTGLSNNPITRPTQNA